MSGVKRLDVRRIAGQRVSRLPSISWMSCCQRHFTCTASLLGQDICGCPCNRDGICYALTCMRTTQVTIILTNCSTGSLRILTGRIGWLERGLSNVEVPEGLDGPMGAYQQWYRTCTHWGGPQAWTGRGVAHKSCRVKQWKTKKSILRVKEEDPDIDMSDVLMNHRAGSYFSYLITIWWILIR